VRAIVGSLLKNDKGTLIHRIFPVDSEVLGLFNDDQEDAGYGQTTTRLLCNRRLVRRLAGLAIDVRRCVVIGSNEDSIRDMKSPRARFPIISDESID
jgi:hypothetical protein